MAAVNLTWRADKRESCKVKPCNEVVLFIICPTGRELKDIFGKNSLQELPLCKSKA